MEVIRFVTTPSSWRVRQWGYLSEWIGLRSRYQRCRKDWEPHMIRCQNRITRELRSHPEVKKVVFCGTGWGLDIPWDSPELAALEEITLVDLFHPWSFYGRAFRDPRIRLVRMDLSGRIAGLQRKEVIAHFMLPSPEYTYSFKADLVVSLNVATQLPIFILERIEKWNKGFSESILEGWGAEIQREYLNQVNSWAGNHLLIADVEESWKNSQGETIERMDPWYGKRPFDPDEQWDWVVAPLGEISSQKYKIHRVGAQWISR